MTDFDVQLAIALDELPFVGVAEHATQGQMVNLLCRVKPGSEPEWAALAEKILRESAKRGKAGWYTHIARQYMLKDNIFVYGWTMIIQSPDLEPAIKAVIAIIHQLSAVVAQAEPPRQQQTVALSSAPSAPYRTASQDDDEDYDPEDDEGGPLEEPDAPLPKGYVPEADVAGNPIVPRNHRVKKIKMAGLPANFDRNAPTEEGKGTWSIESRKGKPFRPPVRR